MCVYIYVSTHTKTHTLMWQSKILVKSYTQAPSLFHMHTHTQTYQCWTTRKVPSLKQKSWTVLEWAEVTGVRLNINAQTPICVGFYNSNSMCKGAVELEMTYDKQKVTLGVIPGWFIGGS